MKQITQNFESSILRMMGNSFYFTLKALFDLKIHLAFLISKRFISN